MPDYILMATIFKIKMVAVTMSIAMGTRVHMNLYIYKSTSVPNLVLLSQNAQSDEKVINSRWTISQESQVASSRRSKYAKIVLKKDNYSR